MSVNLLKHHVQLPLQIGNQCLVCDVRPAKAAAFLVGPLLIVPGAVKRSEPGHGNTFLLFSSPLLPSKLWKRVALEMYGAYVRIDVPVFRTM